MDMDANMETGVEIWAFMYVVPVMVVFVVAGAVYFLSFRTKDGATDQSLRMYLNVLSGDDDKNRKAAKRLRKCGTTRPKVLQNGSGDSKQADSDAEDDSGEADVATQSSVRGTVNWNVSGVAGSATVKSSQGVSKKVDPVESAGATRLTTPALSREQDNSATVTPTSQLPEIVTEEGKSSVTPQTNGSLEGTNGWHVAVSRKERRMNSGVENRSDDTTNHSTTSDESRPSFKNSCSSRNSSPSHRQRLTSCHGGDRQNETGRSSKFTNRRIQQQQQQQNTKISSSTSAHLIQRPDHLKLESSNCTVKVQCQAPTAGRPTILLTRPAETQDKQQSTSTTAAVTINNAKPPQRAHTYGECFKPIVPTTPSAVDICIQTDEDEDFPSPLEGLRQVNDGQPRFIIMMDFSAQVDLDADEGIEPEIALSYEDSDKMRYDSGGSLSSGDGSTRVTPVLEDDYGREFRFNDNFRHNQREKMPQNIHRRSVSDFVHPRQSSSYHYYSYPTTNQNPYYLTSHTRRRAVPDGSGDASERATYFSNRNDSHRPYREKPTPDWMENSPRRGPGRPASGRWRN